MQEANKKTITESQIRSKHFELATKKEKKKNEIFGNFNKFFMYSFLLFWVVISLYPFVWSFFSSFKNPNLINSLGLNPFPGTTDNDADIWTISNYESLFSGAGSLYTWTWIENSIIYSIGSATLNSILNVLGGYALAQIAMRGKNLIVSYFLVSILVPSQATFVPTYYIFYEVGIINRELNDYLFIFAIIFSGMANIIMTFMARQFFLTQTPEMEQAARVEGYSTIRVFFTITIRKMLPLVSTQFVLVFIGSWNNFMTFQLYSGGIPSRMTLNSGSYVLISSNTNIDEGYGQALALSNISFIPMIFLYSFSLKIQLRGIKGGIK